MKTGTPLLSLLLSVILITYSILISGCDQDPPARERVLQTPQTKEEIPAKGQHAKEVSPGTSGLLLEEAMDLQQFESVAEALTVWREFTDEQPIMVFLSAAPALTRTPPELIEQIDYLSANGNRAAIKAASSRSNPQAFFHPSVALDIALRNKWFSQIAWVVPMQDQVMTPDFEGIRNQLFNSNMISEEESTGLIADGKIMQGMLRSTPITVSSISGLSLPNKSAIVHIDLSYLQGLYKNEIATPLLQTIYSTLKALQEQKLNVLAVTFTYGHLDNQIALDVRFIGDIVNTLIEEPALLDQKVPPNWQRQADAIYLTNFFQGEQVDELHMLQEQDDPDSAWVKFSLYRSSASLKDGDKALDYLARAVELDPMYAYEYGNLARMAYERKRPDETMRMYSLASKALPNDHLIKLSMAELAAELGDHKTAKHLAEELSELPWSPPYHSNMHNYLESFISKMETEDSGQERN